MIIKSNYYLLIGCLLFITGISIMSCSETKDPDQILRLKELSDYCDKQDINLSQYDYILVEGFVKCKGCSQIWPSRISTGPLINSSVLVICSEKEVFDQFGLENGVAYITKLDSINRAFPYIANYFLFYRKDGEFDSYVELGTKKIAIPESLR